MKRAHRRDHQLPAHFDTNPVLPDGLHIGGPLVDEGDIQPGSSHVGADAGTVGAGAKDGYFHVFGIGGAVIVRSGFWPRKRQADAPALPRQSTKR